MTKIAASILSADFADLAADCQRLLNQGTDLLHFDVMDGHFVPNISFGAPVLECLHKALPEVFYDVHLMISNPVKYAPRRALTSSPSIWRLCPMLSPRPSPPSVPPAARWASASSRAPRPRLSTPTSTTWTSSWS